MKVGQRMGRWESWTKRLLIPRLHIPSNIKSSHVLSRWALKSAGCITIMAVYELSPTARKSIILCFCISAKRRQSTDVVLFRCRNFTHLVQHLFTQPEPVKDFRFIGAANKNDGVFNNHPLLYYLDIRPLGSVVFSRTKWPLTPLPSSLQL